MKKELVTGIKTIIFMCISTLMLLLAVSLLYYKLHISDSKIAVGVVLVYFVTTFIGGFIYGKIKEKNKYLYGIIIGMVYFAVLFAVSMIFKGDGKIWEPAALYALLSCISGGMIGGMLG